MGVLETLLVCGVVLFPVIPAANITVTVRPGDLVVRERDPFTLNCTASVDDAASLEYYWEKDEELVLNGSRQFSVSHASTSDAGVYVCIVQADEIQGTSTNATITVIASGGADDGPVIALIVCITAVTIIFIIFFTSIGLYLSSRETSKTCCCESQKGGKHHKLQRVPARLSPSVPRHFTNRDRSKSKSLSQLLQVSYPLSSNLCRSSSNLLSGSQPTQVTDVEDPGTLNDLGLDESLFEQSLPGTPPNGRNHKAHSQNKSRAMRKKGERTGRRASEGTLVVQPTMKQSTSLKTILKESKSVNESLNEPGNRSSAMSDISSEVTHSDDNSLHLRKSVRFNVEEWAEDSGVHTGSSTPHYTPYPSLTRRASEPETSGYRYSNGERRGSAPGDLANRPQLGTEGEYAGDVDEGMATGSEQWGQQEHEFDFEKGLVEKRFEGIFSSENEAEIETHNKTRALRIDVGMSDNIASRVAQLYSATKAPLHSSEGSARGPSPLATSSYNSSSISVSEVKKKLLQRKATPQASTTSNKEEDRKRAGHVSKLAKERVELFRAPTERLRTASLDRAHLRRGKPLDIGMYQALRDGFRPMKTKVNTEKVASPHKPEKKKATRSSPVSKTPPDPVAIPVFSGHSSLSNWAPAKVASPKQQHKPEKKKATRSSPVSKTPPDPVAIPVFSDHSSLSNWAPAKVASPKQQHKPEKKKATRSSPGSKTPPDPVAIPVFSGHSSLSNWVPACLRETVISPYHSYEDDNEISLNKEEEEEDSESSDDEDMIMMEPLKPTVGTPLTTVGSIPKFGGVATVTPIGRSWLSSPNRSLGSSPMALPIKPIIPGAKDMSLFNESMHLQHGGHLLGAIKRLSVIPEETASVCSSMTSMHTEHL